MSYNQHPQPVENHTDAFFAAFGVLLFMVFWAIAAMAGFLWVFLTALVIDRIGTWLMRFLT
jgi:hypothetical protein